MKKKKILLLHTSNVLLHYRVDIYNYFSKEFHNNGFEFIVLTTNIQKDNPYEVHFKLYTVEHHHQLYNLYLTIDPDIIITFSSLKDIQVIPLIISQKLKRKKVVYWGHGVNLNNPKKNKIFFNLWHSICDNILLYSHNEIKYISKKNKSKITVANNTLNFTSFSKNYDETILKNYGVTTKKNIIFVGRIEPRKKIHDLIEAFFKLQTKLNVGLIIIGPDPDNILKGIKHPRIFNLGPIYGELTHTFLHFSSIYCIPGHVGLGIVDAFHHSLPIITENVKHAPEIGYLENEVNGYVVEENNIEELASKLAFLLENDAIREEMGKKAKSKISNDGNIKSMFKSFLSVCQH